MRTFIVSLTVITLGAVCAPAPAAAQRRVSRTIDASIDRGTGEKVRGPATITLRNLNVLRYEIAIGKDVHFTAGPDLAGLPFIPVIPSAGEAKEGAASSPASSDAAIGRIRAMVTGVETTYGTLRGRVTERTRLVAGAASRLDALLRSSDAVLQTNGVAALLSRLRELKLEEGTAAAWPIGAELETELVRLAAIESELSAVAAPQAGSADASAHAYLKARIPQLRTALEAFRDSGEIATAFRRSQDDLRRWQQITQSIVDGEGGSFERVIPSDCGFQFDSTKEAKLELVTRDRLTANAPEVRRELVTVVCSTPLSVSGGFGFSFVDEATFALVASKPDSGDTAVAKFGVSARSTYRPLPALLLNTRMYEADDVWSIHASGGAVVDISTGEAGTDIEFIIGPTLAIGRTFFVTAGWHWGRVEKLAGGFSEGDTVPQGMTTPPIEKSWSKHFALLATWKLR